MKKKLIWDLNMDVLNIRLTSNLLFQKYCLDILALVQFLSKRTTRDFLKMLHFILELVFVFSKPRSPFNSQPRRFRVIAFLFVVFCDRVEPEEQTINFFYIDFFNLGHISNANCDLCSSQTAPNSIPTS